MNLWTAGELPTHQIIPCNSWSMFLLVAMLWFKFQLWDNQLGLNFPSALKMAARLSVQSLWFVKITGTQHMLYQVYAGLLPFRGACSSAVLSKAALGIIWPTPKTIVWRYNLWLLQPHYVLFLKRIIWVLEYIKLERQNAIQRTRNDSPGSA